MSEKRNWRYCRIFGSEESASPTLRNLQERGPQQWRGSLRNTCKYSCARVIYKHLLGTSQYGDFPTQVTFSSSLCCILGEDCHMCREERA